MIKLFKEFLEYKRLKEKVDTIKPTEEVLATIRNSNKLVEDKILQLTLNELSKLMIAEKIHPEYYRGFRQALIWRIQFVNSKKTAIDSV